MTSRTWRKGPPPHVGWWNASLIQNSGAWRWWNGICWSNAALKHEAAVSAINHAKVSVVAVQGDIEWTTYYPKNARVPRIDPSKGKAK